MSRRKPKRPPSAIPAPSAASTATPPPSAIATSRASRGAAWAGLGVVLVVAAAGFWWFQRSGKPPPPLPPQAAAPAPAPAVASAGAQASFVGSEACAACHTDAYAAWKPTRHARAMQHATQATVLGDFANARFRYAGVESRFFRRDGRYFAHTDGADGKTADFEIKYTFGVDPLQQYLVEFPDGRLQALPIAWDSRPKEQGGQRWFHLYPNDKVDHRDELHWTRYLQNWNFMCADCHSTDVHKNYDAASNTYRTSFSEISVGCEACHGPGSRHLEWAKTKAADPTHGLAAALNERAGVTWTIDPATGNAVRSTPRAHDVEIETCAQCHARRGQVADGYQAGKPFLDFYRPALITAPLYFADGQQRDEDYVWGSFLQSRMYRAGVTCSDCHDPHTQKLRAQGNALCATCHLAAKYDAPAHHHHPGSAGGTRCVECHMPAKNYMVVDPRQDHSLRIPRPDLSVRLGVPNACNGCHADHDAQWAAAAVLQWYGHEPRGFQRYAEAFAGAEHGSANSGRDLATLAADPASPAIARATAISLLGGHLTIHSVEAADPGLADPSALVRLASVETLATMPAGERRGLLGPMLEDPVRIVRMEAAAALADAMAGAAPSTQDAFDRAAKEYENSLQYNADRPESRTALGSFYSRQGRFGEAEAELRAALALDPRFVPAYVNLADLMRAQQRDAQADTLLRAAIRQVPEAAVLHYTLGLTLTRLGRKGEALAEFERAHTLSPDDPRFAYVYAVALHSSGRTAAALGEIDKALGRSPDNRDLLIAEITFRRDANDLAGARQYARRFAQSYPDDPDAGAMLRELGAVN
jgi:tetratricopeptide (TPR) repeat protein